LSILKLFETTSLNLGIIVGFAFVFIYFRHFKKRGKFQRKTKAFVGSCN